MQIIEYIGKEGVITSPLPINIRAMRPMPGDPIELENGEIGRLEGFNTATQEWTICEKTMGVFMYKNSVDISGGPFISAKKITPKLEFRNVDFWNWGDRVREADQGVDYIITRPLFKIEEI